MSTGLHFGAGYHGSRPTPAPGSSTSSGSTPLTFSYGTPDFSTRTRTNDCFIRTFHSGTNSTADQSARMNDLQMNELEYYQQQVINLLGPGAEVGFNYTTRILVFRHDPTQPFQRAKFDDLNSRIPGFADAMGDLEAAVQRQCPMRGFKIYTPGSLKGNAIGATSLQRGTSSKTLENLPTTFQEAGAHATSLQLPAGKDPNVFSADSNPNASAKKLAYVEAFYTAAKAQIDAKIPQTPPNPGDANYAEYVAWKKCKEDFEHCDPYAISAAIRFLPNNAMNLNEAANTVSEVLNAQLLPPESKLDALKNFYDPAESEKRHRDKEAYARDVGGLVFSTNTQSIHAIQDYYLYSTSGNDPHNQGLKRDGLEDSILKLTRMIDPDFGDATAIAGYRDALERAGRPDARTAPEDELRAELQRHHIMQCFGAFIARQDASIRDQLSNATGTGILQVAAIKTTELDSAQTALNALPTATLPERHQAARQAFGLNPIATPGASAPGVFARARTRVAKFFSKDPSGTPPRQIMDLRDNGVPNVPTPGFFDRVTNFFRRNQNPSNPPLGHQMPERDEL